MVIVIIIVTKGRSQQMPEQADYNARSNEVNN
jgi:hypothetical protein